MQYHILDITIKNPQETGIPHILSLLKKHTLSLQYSRLKTLPNKLYQWRIHLCPPLSDNQTISAMHNSVKAFIQACKPYYSIEDLGLMPLIPHNQQNTWYVLTVLSKTTLEPTVLRVIQETLLSKDHSTERETFLSPNAYEKVFNDRIKPLSRFKQEIMMLQKTLSLDIIIRPLSHYSRSIEFAAFDMDGTLIKNEVIDELSKEAGTYNQVQATTQKAMQGKMDFNESLRARLQLLKGLTYDHFTAAYERVVLTPGSKKLLLFLRCIHCHTAILSGGFSFFTKKIQKIMHINQVFSNTLEIQHGKTTGDVIGEIIGPYKKKIIFEKIIKEKHFDPQKTVAVGDGSNDLLMLQSAQFGIAFHAKPILEKHIHINIKYSNMDALLYLFGWHDDEINFIMRYSKSF